MSFALPFGNFCSSPPLPCTLVSHLVCLKVALVLLKLFYPRPYVVHPSNNSTKQTCSWNPCSVHMLVCTVLLRGREAQLLEHCLVSVASIQTMSHLKHDKQLHIYLLYSLYVNCRVMKVILSSNFWGIFTSTSSFQVQLCLLESFWTLSTSSLNCVYLFNTYIHNVLGEFIITLNTIISP